MRRSLPMGRLCALLLLAFPAGAWAAPHREVAVAVAADLRFAMDKLVAGFEVQHPDIFVKPSFGSSGNFYAQLRAEAPFDLFLSADASYPNLLRDAGLSQDGRVFSYAEGSIVLWAPTPIADKVLSLDSLKDPAIKRIAIANPAHAPYGRAAEAALKSLGLYDAAKPKLVLGENIVQTAQFAETGAADVAIIALSVATAPELQKEGRYIPVPRSAYPKLEQGGVILKWAKDKEACGAFRDYLFSTPGQQILKAFGFLIPGE